MSRSRLIRRSLAPVAVAAAATAGLALGASPASALSRPGVNISHYQLTPTESWNVCGGSNAILTFVDPSAVMVVDCGTGDVTIYGGAK